MAAYPPDPRDLAVWFAGHEAEWWEGSAFRFAIEHQEKMIGLVDLDEIDGGEADLGYWLEETYWGQGITREAATALVRFAFEQAGLVGLRSGHTADNPASGRVLNKLGFRRIDEVTVPSRARGLPVLQLRYRLASPIIDHSS
jgi:RimJ/RimL family protein N-acetyltransferase